MVWDKLIPGKKLPGAYPRMI